ncbi:hypothetical protein CMO90_03070 [Candidatus Woesearchaeota archaeon]|jgi:ribosomal protein S3AE|nr:hypothetical protein [Candidatus Woesearchaeota archaeon]|tara:strand:- start:2095 stop:2913 length:819 start_codon:yes stop_codon:yes gene_type:complete
MVKKKSIVKKIKKKWFPIIAPKIIGERIIGESLLADSNSMKGRYITQNLMNLLGEPRKQGINLQFKIKAVNEGQGITTTTKYEMTTSAVKRIVRRGRTKIDDSFILKIQDCKVRIKTLIISNSKVPKSVASNLRLSARKILKENLAKNGFEKIVEELLKFTIQKDLRAKLAKIVPLRNFEIRSFKLLEKEEKEVEETKKLKVEKTTIEKIEEEKKTKNEAKEDGKVKVAKEEEEETKKEVKKTDKKSVEKKEVKKETSETEKPTEKQVNKAK